MPDLQAAIEAAASGRYAQALAQAAEIEATADPLVISAACCLRGSILRQLHQHQDAEAADRRALDHAGPGASDTRIDALVGLTADAIADPRRALARWQEVEPLLAGASLRVRIRAGWVGAEVHLACDQHRTALMWAGASATQAELVSARHAAKSLLVLGVCQMASGEALGVESVRTAAVRAAAERLRPVLWPSAYLLACWLPEPASGRWWRWSQQVVESIAADLPVNLRIGWQSDPAIAALRMSPGATAGPGTGADSPIALAP